VTQDAIEMLKLKQFQTVIQIYQNLMILILYRIQKIANQIISISN